MKLYKAIVPVKDLLDESKLHVKVGDMIKTYEYDDKIDVKLIQLPNENNLIVIMYNNGIQEQVHVDHCFVEIDAVLASDVISLLNRISDELGTY